MVVIILSEGKDGRSKSKKAIKYLANKV